MRRYHMREVAVAVLDTGIYPHVDFDNRIIAFADMVGKGRLPYDDNSHGTHVAGIIGGSGRASAGRFKGMAPDCNIVAVKVLDKFGNGKVGNVLRGIEWVIKNAWKYNIRVLNLSFGATDTNGTSEKLLIAAVEQAWDRHIVVVTAAGNEGPDIGSVTVPGISKKVITVGSVDDDEYTDSSGRVHYNYSGRGPTRDCIVKPEILTVGSNIVSCSNSKTGYTAKSGTSMSAPIVAGAITRLLQKYPHFTPRDVKMRLLETAVPLNLEKEHQGWGVLDLERFL